MQVMQVKRVCLGVLAPHALRRRSFSADLETENSRRGGSINLHPFIFRHRRPTAWPLLFELYRAYETEFIVVETRRPQGSSSVSWAHSGRARLTIVYDHSWLDAQERCLRRRAKPRTSYLPRAFSLKTVRRRVP